jgi:hypothetical protein
MFKPKSFKAFEKVSVADLEKLLCKQPVSVALLLNDCIKNYVSGIIDDDG